MKRAVLFAHYDRDGIVDDHVLHALRAHKETSNHLIFISTASLDEEQKTRAARFADIVLVRDNSGYDFMSWKFGLAHLDAPESYDEILFTNDSIYGPLWPLAEIYDRAHGIDADLWGLCINHQFSRHVQSYFFAFRKNLISSNVMAEFWEGVGPIADKMTVVKTYELGLTKFVEERGFKIGAIFEPHWLSPMEKLQLILSDVDLREPWRSYKFAARVIATKTMSPNHELWRHMIEAGVPFIKIELMRDNPHDVGLRRIYRLVAKMQPYYDDQNIKQHILRLSSIIGARKQDETGKSHI